MQRLASGSGEYVPLELSEPREVGRIARDLEVPTHRLGEALRALARDSTACEQPLLEIQESLRAISDLVRELCFAVVAGDPPTHISRSSVLCGASVLLVGEDINHVQSLSRILREAGVAPVTATSVPECLVRVTAQRPEAVIVDFALGAALASMLATVAPQLPVIITTAVPILLPDQAHILANANAHVLDQPYSRADLLGLLEVVLLEPQARMR